MTALQEGIFEQIVAERKRQDDKFGEQNHQDLYWLGILVEEVGEVAQALIQGQSPVRVATELLHVQAVSVSWAEARARRAMRGIK